MKKVVYLFGAGASHGSVKAVGSSHGILMRDLGPLLNSEVRELLSSKYPGHPPLTDLVNAVINEDTDFEHIITFLDDSPSELHRRFAGDLRQSFEKVLKYRLSEIDAELGDSKARLYSALLDMHQVPGFDERLAGVLTLNYDDYIELAARTTLGSSIDFGIHVDGAPVTEERVKLLKLHGSFGWENVWPVKLGSDQPPLWIPPGIQKAKNRYPFNVLWGLAREILDCDILRIVGCRLGPNDWDLVSLIFTTCHSRSTHRPYSIEIIDSPSLADELKERFPYLNAQSIVELESVGPQLVSEYLGGVPRTYGGLEPEEQVKLKSLAGRDKNWFRIWLKQMAETLFTKLGSVRTNSGTFEALLESH